jgi:small-conductance mechanosensitive channel
MSYEKEKTQSFRSGFFKVVLYMILLSALSLVLDMFFRWSSVEEMPLYLVPYSSIIFSVHPYLVYIKAALVFIFGYLTISAIASMVYAYMHKISDHPTAATLRTITRISGIAVLLSMMTSVLNVDPTAALTVGSFGGLVVGFATQTILSHVVAGVFLLISRPFTYGDVITVAGQTGVVKEVKLMHLVIETEDKTKDILIPSGNVVSQIIQKKKSLTISKPINTVLTLDTISKKVKKDLKITFTAKLIEEPTGKPIEEVEVKILDKDIGEDDLLASGKTQKNGTFSIDWKAKQTDPSDNTVEVYAIFEGNKHFLKSKSKMQTITLKN